MANVCTEFSCTLQVSSLPSNQSFYNFRAARWIHVSHPATSNMGVYYQDWVKGVIGGGGCLAERQIWGLKLHRTSSIIYLSFFVKPNFSASRTRGISASGNVVLRPEQLLAHFDTKRHSCRVSRTWASHPGGYAFECTLELPCCNWRFLCFAQHLQPEVNVMNPLEGWSSCKADSRSSDWRNVLSFLEIEALLSFFTRFHHMPYPEPDDHIPVRVHFNIIYPSTSRSLK